MGVVIALIVLRFVGSPIKIGKAGRQGPETLQQDPAQPPPLVQMAASGEVEAPAPERTSSGEASIPASHIPVISLPPDADSLDLEGVMLPPLPYCIYTGAYKDFQEAATTQSELDSNYLPGYIVPVEINGNVAQSLFGVTQDGLWYRVLTGHFGSKEEARETLAVMMEELPGYQPEILRFPYAVECGRFLAPDEPRTLSERLDQENVFHYTQTYPTSNDRTLTRVLVGCFFSKKGAEDQAGRLQGKGFSCTVAER